MFDTKKFKTEKFTQRTADVPVPDLKKWFSKGKKAVWKVRGLTGREVGVCKVAAAKNKSLAGIMEMLQSAEVKDKTEAMEAVLDLGKNRITTNVAERIEQLTIGSLAPECDMDLALKICEYFPVDFYSITNEILKLTGLGMVPGELKGSGKKRT